MTSFAPGVEPLAALEDYGPGPLVMVSHNAFNRALLSQLDAGLADVDQRTACWNELSRVGSQWHVDAFNLIHR